MNFNVLTIPAPPSISEIRAMSLPELRRIECSIEGEPTRRFQIGLLEYELGEAVRPPLCQKQRAGEVSVSSGVSELVLV